VKPVLLSNTLLTKSLEYDLLYDWLGRGLLTNNGLAWRQKRKILTPAFHFKILENFIPIMNEQANVLISVLKQSKQDHVHVLEKMKLCTLDIICGEKMLIKMAIFRA